MTDDDPITAGIIITTVAATAAAGMQAAQSYSTSKAESGLAQNQADALHQQALIAQSSAAANEATTIRRGAGQLGEQAAAFGEANVGTSGSAADVERQSAGMARLDALNIWYGGQLEARGLEQEAAQQRYSALVSRDNATMALIGGGINVGSKIVQGATQYGAYSQKGIIPGYGGGGSPY